MRLILVSTICFGFLFFGEKPVYTAETVAIDIFGEIYNVYAIPGTGKYKGWEQLKGFKGEELLAVYFNHDTTGEFVHTSYKSEYIGKYDFTKKISWVDGLGLVHVGTLGEMFGICTFNSNSIPKLEKEFGHIYDEWFELNTINYANYVEKYLVGVGRIKPVVSPIDMYAAKAEDMKIPLTEEEKIRESLKPIIEKSISDYNEIIIKSVDYYTDEWVSESNIKFFGLSCVSSVDKANTWEIYKNFIKIHEIKFSSDALKKAQNEVVLVDDVRVQISNRHLNLNVFDLISLGLIDSEMYMYIPDNKSFSNDAIRLYLEENYPNANPKDYFLE
jgi:hypothetical protein